MSNAKVKTKEAALQSQLSRSQVTVVRLYDALSFIAKGYQSPEQLRRTSEAKYGLRYEEALEYAYENLISDAKEAIRGVRRPKQQAASTTPGDTE